MIKRVRFITLFGVLCFNVNISYSRLENPDLGSVSACFDEDGFVLDADDLTDNTSDSGDLIADLEVISHVSGLFFLFLLRLIHKEIEDNEHEHEHDDGSKSASAGGNG